ncbi:MAG: hypothetical protein AAGK22_29735 [Acidobacteriota bacterium]
MSYSKSVTLWAVVLCLVGALMAGWGPLLVIQLVGAELGSTASTLEQLGQPESAQKWVGYTVLRILGALLLGLGAALVVASRLRSTEARRMVLIGLGWGSGLTLLMALIQVQAILSVFTPLTWLVPGTAALLLLHSLWLLKSQKVSAA